MLDCEQRKRLLLFPLIAHNVSTGVNTYRKEMPSKDYDYVVCYMHASLDKKDDHRAILDKKLAEYSPIIVSNECEVVVNRYADYSIPEVDWFKDVTEDDILSGKTKLFDEKSRRIPELAIAKEMVSNKEVVIMEQEQQELRLFLDKRDITEVLKIFENNVFKCQFCPKTGNRIYKDANIVERTEYITDSWEVPVIIVNRDRPDLSTNVHESYLDTSRIDVRGFDGDVNFFINEKIDVAKKYLDMQYNGRYGIEKVLGHIVFRSYMDEVLDARRFEGFKNDVEAMYEKMFSKNS